jgi:hypothetical protein
VESGRFSASEDRFVAQHEKGTESQAKLLEQIEETQVDLRHSIALNRMLVEQTQRLLDHHRQARENSGR